MHTQPRAEGRGCRATASGVSHRLQDRSVRLAALMGAATWGPSALGTSMGDLDQDVWVDGAGRPGS